MVVFIFMKFMSVMYILGNGVIRNKNVSKSILSKNKNHKNEWMRSFSKILAIIWWERIWNIFKAYKLYVKWTLIRESWKINPKRGTITERVLRKKSRAQRCVICICFFPLYNFSINDARWWSRKMAFIFVQRGIFPLILAYAIWSKFHKKAQLALYLHI